MSIRYAVRVRGSSGDAALVAQQAGLEVETVSVTTTISGRFRDQAALFGSLARLRLLGLEVMDVRRLPRPHGKQGKRLDYPEADGGGPSSPR
jgi:hypothetical protein